MHGPIRVNAVVKVTGSDWMALGDVRYCIAQREHYAVGLQIEHILVNLNELARLNQSLSDPEPQPQTEPQHLPSRDREGAVPALPLPQEPKQLLA
jgi:hypothetical protein